jgi:hypothetical protein
MKDYQKALDKLESDYKASGWHNLSPNQFAKFKDELQELVSKATPMKVTEKKYPFMDMNGLCPACGERIDSECNEEHHLDSDCLQALDWTND